MITILVVGFSIGFLHFIGTFPEFLTSPTLDIKFAIMMDTAILVLFPIFIKILLSMDFPRRLPPDRRYTRLMTESEWINFLVQKQNQIQGSFYG